MKTFRGILILSLLLTVSNADNNQSTQNEFIYIDKLHKSISETVLEWSDIIDTTLSNWLENNETNITTVDETNETTDNNETNITTDDETNTTTIVETNTTTIVETNATTIVETNATIAVINVPVRSTTAATYVPSNTTAAVTHVHENTLEERVKSADAFFQNNKYLDETENNYVRIRLGSYFQSKESSDFDITLRAQMPFRKSKKNLKIFVENINVDNAKDILKDDDSAPDIGIHYFRTAHDIISRYSIGLSGIDPFVKARYNMPIKTDKWLIDLVQLFQYSTDDKFEEETNIYFDKEVGKKSLLRIQLHRSTHEDVDGMNYALSLRYYESLKKHTGFGFAQTFVGNTEYQYTDDNGIEPPQIKTFGGINDYITSVSLRKNIWRKWFFCEVRPSVSFHKQYDYDPNYRIRVFFDIYLGKFN